jgi:hypothetical protein
VNEIAVNSHVPEAGFNGDGFVRDDPRRVGGHVIHLHGETHGRIDRANAPRLERGYDLSADMVDLMPGPVELEIGNRARGAAHRLARHAYHVAHQHLCPRIIAKKLVTLWVEPGSGDLDQADIIGTALSRELAQLCRIRALGQDRSGLCLQALHCWMIFELHIQPRQSD